MTDKEELVILSNHLQSVGRERDYWKQQAEEFKKQSEELQDELFLAREALARSFK
jgi:hypothetical protein